MKKSKENFGKGLWKMSVLMEKMSAYCTKTNVNMLLMNHREDMTKKTQMQSSQNFTSRMHCECQATKLKNFASKMKFMQKQEETRPQHQKSNVSLTKMNKVGVAM